MHPLHEMRKARMKALVEVDLEAAKKKMADVGLDDIGKPKMLRGDEKQAHVMANIGGGKYKYIKFGQAGANQISPDEADSPQAKERRAAFKARFAKDIARGPSSAAYWANKFLW